MAGGWQGAYGAVIFTHNFLCHNALGAWPRASPLLSVALCPGMCVATIGSDVSTRAGTRSLDQRSRSLRGTRAVA